ncbi:hypothetical protein [Desulfosporosinus sp. Sb-LF]|nr:hypothetical protein [Desulfosporosinus sp. Sb-LF]
MTKLEMTIHAEELVTAIIRRGYPLYPSRPPENPRGSRSENL